MMDDFEDDPADADDIRGLLPKTLHKALVTGVSAVLMTEEGIRKTLSDVRLPKDAIAYVIQQTDKSRKELLKALTGELKGYLHTADIPRALRKALTGMRLEVRADIRFVDDESSETAVETSLRDSRKARRPETETEGEDEDEDEDEDESPQPTTRKRRTRTPRSKGKSET